MKRTYQPKKLHRKKRAWLYERMSTRNGRKVLSRDVQREEKSLSYNFLLVQKGAECTFYDGLCAVIFIGAELFSVQVSRMYKATAVVVFFLRKQVAV
jgi:large subunit ribosomal protein L34